MKLFTAAQHKKNMIWHKSILIVRLIELYGQISDIYAAPWWSIKNKWGMTWKF